MATDVDGRLVEIRRRQAAAAAIETDCTQRRREDWDMVLSDRVAAALLRAASDQRTPTGAYRVFLDECMRDVAEPRLRRLDG